ncbi:MAG: hypothetical protein U0270_41565 [Labilithrix sp.]
MSLARISKRAVALATTAVLIGVSGAASARPVNPLELMTGFAAKEGCSCVFVSEQTDAYCTSFAQPGPVPIAVTIDHAAQTVTGSVAGVSRTARFSAGRGCVLDGLP